VPSPPPAPPTTGLVLKPFAVPRPTYPAARPLGLITVALAYFALGVGVGLVMKRIVPQRRWLGVLVAGGAVAALGYLAWVARSLA
jgi:hypothetical protein